MSNPVPDAVPKGRVIKSMPFRKRDQFPVLVEAMERSGHTQFTSFVEEAIAERAQKLGLDYPRKAS